ncbi:hypothetical protein A2450_03200 [candidate division WWE3 bacterium RIFOXYC2_FULL_40_11]|nr:MAG: hypothetical protein A2450_03200 [candidate division WWE3 bacterium RIFOXYC2_FULL_40_11]
MAALMPPKKSDEDPAASVQVNIIGVANVAVACMKRNIRMIYISTDYVFRGDEGDYKEEDSLYAPNKYAWSKLGGECVMRMYGNGVIVRLSFGPMKFPYPKAFSDQYTSKESVGVVAQKIAKIIESDFLGVIHIGGKRRSVFEYAKSLEGSEAVEAMSRLDVRDYIVPKDTSLNSTKYDQLFNSEKEYGLI